MKQRLKWNGMIFDDFQYENLDGYEYYWTQICSSCIKKHNLEKHNYLDDSGSGICGVVGCNNDDDTVYLDIPKNEAEIIEEA